ncbi:MAG: hypothetical protein HKP27_08750 [Myxococcales bacterium]|nr:hypothetical protein [Myxococcales bacterium]
MSGELAARDIQCFLGWSRRNVYPPHPNIHTDHDFARERGFPGAIMSASQIVPHLHEAVIDAVGCAVFFGGTRLRYKMVRPIGSESRAHVRVLRTDDPTTLELRVENAEGDLCIVGEAVLPEGGAVAGVPSG